MLNNAEAVRLLFADSVPLRTVLIVGCGPDREPEWMENGFLPTFLDIEPKNKPDILCDMCELPQHAGPYDAVFACHCIEHLYPHQVYKSLTGFKRVLKPGGMVVILVPDLEDVKPTSDVLYTTPHGPICGLHLFYGDATQIPDFPHMAHHCGFTQETMSEALQAAGFDNYRSERLPNYNLMGVGVKYGVPANTADLCGGEQRETSESGIRYSHTEVAAATSAHD